MLMPEEEITVINDNTEIIPYDLGAWGSRTSFVCGNAAKTAAEEVKKEVMIAAGKMMDRNPDALEAK